MSYILIIGAKSDIARAVARKYAKSGHNLYLSARCSSELNSFAVDLAIRESIDIECMPKATPVITPRGKLSLQNPDDYYEIDTWGTNSEVYIFSPKSNPNYRCTVILLDYTVDGGMDCKPKK